MKRPKFQAAQSQRMGFTYIGMLILLTILGVTTVGLSQFAAVIERSQAEDELLKIGLEFHNAFTNFSRVTPIGQKRQPMNLKDLLSDNRFPTPKRHLRKMYRDPITRGTEWGIVFAADGSGGIIGVFSLSKDIPIKRANFSSPFKDFEGRAKFSEWVFGGAELSITPIRPN